MLAIFAAWVFLFSGRFSGSAQAACACPQPAVIVVPRPGDVAPRNTHVWISVPPALADAPASMKGATAGETRRYGSGEERIIELIPGAPLAGHMRYEVFLGNEVVGQLTTGDTMDQTPPTWDGLQSGQVSPGTSEGCGAGETIVVLGLGKRDDEATPAASLRYAVWIAEPGKDIDYTKPPTTILGAVREHLALGRESRCNPSNFELGGAPAFAVGVRVLDFAGNAGTPSEADITLPRPTAPPRTQSPQQK